MLGEKGKTPALLLPRLPLNQDAFPQLCFFFVVVAGFFLLYLQIIHTVNSPGEKAHPSLAVSTLRPSLYCISTCLRFPGSLVQDADGSG